MVNILQRPQSIGEMFAQKIGGGIERGVTQGLDTASKLSIEKARGRGLAQEAKQLEKVKLLEQGRQTIAAMRAVGQKGNLGRFSSVPGFFGGKTAKDRAEYEQLGRSLIPIVAAGVPIRNQREFDEYKKIITDPSATDSEREGALDALDGLLERSVGQDMQQDFSSQIRGSPKKKSPSQVDDVIEEEEPFQEQGKLSSVLSAGTKGLIKGGRSFSPLPNLGAISAEQAQNLMQQFLPSQEGGLEDIAEFTGENIPAVSMGAGGIGSKLLSALTGSLAKKGAKELGAPEMLQDVIGGAGMNAPALSKAALSKTLQPSKKQLEVVNYLKNKGFTERQITPLIQDKKKVSYLSKVAIKEDEKGKLASGIKEGFNDIYDSIKSKGQSKILEGNGLANFTDDLNRRLSKMPPKVRRLAEQSVNDLFSEPVTFKSLSEFKTNVGEASEAAQGVKKYVGILKEDAQKAMEHLDSSLAAENKFVDSMYGKYKNFTEKMTIKDGEKYLALKKFSPAAAAFMALKFGIMPKVFIAGALTPITAKEFLTNPRLQRIHAKMWKEFKSGNMKTVEKLFQTLKKNPEKEKEQED